MVNLEKDRDSYHKEDLDHQKREGVIAGGLGLGHVRQVEVRDRSRLEGAIVILAVVKTIMIQREILKENETLREKKPLDIQVAMTLFQNLTLTNRDDIELPILQLSIPILDFILHKVVYWDVCNQ